MTAPYVGGVRRRRKLQVMLCVSWEPWIYSDTSIWFPFSWAQRMLQVRAWRQFEILIREQGCHDMDIRLWGTKGLSERPTCSGTERARTHILLYSIVRIIGTHRYTLFETCRGFSFKAVWYV